MSMKKQRYALSLDSKERLILAMEAAITAYFANEDAGHKVPGFGFFANFLQPFFEREELERDLLHLHGKLGPMAIHERDIANRLAVLVDTCTKKIADLK